MLETHKMTVLLEYTDPNFCDILLIWQIMKLFDNSVEVVCPLIYVAN